MSTKILGSGRFTISGEAAELEFTVSLVGADQTNLAVLAQVQETISDQAFRSAMQERVDKHVDDAFGKKYAAEPIVIDAKGFNLKVTVTAVYVEVYGRKALAKHAGEALETIRRDLREQLQQRTEAAHPAVRAQWAEGSGISTDEFLLSADTPEPELQARLLTIRARRDRLVRIQYGSLAGAALFIIFATVLAVQGDPFSALIFAAYAAPFVAGWLLIAGRIPEVDAEIREIGNERDLRAIEEENVEARAQKLFQVHSVELKRYYDQALRQGRNIFYVGILCIALGFGVIIAAFAVIAAANSPNLDEKIVLASLSAVGGALANFIGVIYLRMFSDTVKAVTGFHQRLVVTHHLHFGNFLAAKITDDKIREQTLAEMAGALSNGSLLGMDEPEQNGNAVTAKAAGAKQ
jgi:hypothetical protein